MVAHVFIENEFPSIRRCNLSFDARAFIGYRFSLIENKKKSAAIFLWMERDAPHSASALTIDETHFKGAYPVLNEEMLTLAKNVAEYYFSPLAETLALMLPPSLKRVPKATPVQSPSPSSSALPLHEKQEAIYREIIRTPPSALNEHLIWGVTGSGKTRIYENLIKDALKEGSQTLLLVPEIALSSQIMQIMRARFQNNVVLYHSALSTTERLHAYRRFLTGEAKIAIGTRSAIFLPAANLTQIIIDEEHDASYKDQRKIRFEARTVARLRLNGKVRLVLGSATPSLESLARAKTGVAKLYRLRTRATGQTLPKIFIPEYKPQHGLVAPFLMQKMHEHLSAGNQVLLLMNRRGHSTRVYCPGCDAYADCPRCAIALTYHKDNTLRCHYCGYSEDYSPHCPKDSSPRRLSGRGIQRIEEILEAQFAPYEYARLDRDTTRTKGFTDEVLHWMHTKKIQILIGTQMIAKGFDIEGVTLVGVLGIDALLGAPDFRAAESAWQLLVQVVGRSGRHQAGEVVIQTTTPHHTVMNALVEHNDDAFYAEEARLRKLAHYPPYVSLARLILIGHAEEIVFREAEKLAKAIEPINTKDLFEKTEISQGTVSLLGPALPQLTKIDNEYRVHFLIKAPSESVLRSYLVRIHPILERFEKSASSRFILDMDPRETS